MHGAGETAIGLLGTFGSHLSGTVEEQNAALSGLREQLAAAGEENRTLATGISSELDAAIARVSEGGRSSLANLERGQSEALDLLRQRMAAAGAEQTAHARNVIGSLESAVGRLKDSSQALLDDLESGQGERVASLAATIGEGKRAGHRPARSRREAKR